MESLCESRLFELYSSFIHVWLIVAITLRLREIPHGYMVPYIFSYNVFPRSSSALCSYIQRYDMKANASFAPGAHTRRWCRFRDKHFYALFIWYRFRIRYIISKKIIYNDSMFITSISYSGRDCVLLPRSLIRWGWHFFISPCTFSSFCSRTIPSRLMHNTHVYAYVCTYIIYEP